jgi:hypothetical protein
MNNEELDLHMKISYMQAQISCLKAMTEQCEAELEKYKQQMADKFFDEKEWT